MNNLVRLFASDSQVQLQIKTLIFCLCILFVMTYVYPKTYAFVIILVVFVLFIMETYVRVENENLNDVNKTTMLQLIKLQNKMLEYEKQREKRFKAARGFKKEALDSLFIDASLIHFLHELLPLYEYNPGEYYLLLKGANRILKLRKSIEDYYAANETVPSNIAEMLEIALELKTKTINNIHTFIYTVPKQRQMYTYVENAIEQYAYVIDDSINIIHQYYLLSIKNINTSTKFIYPKSKHAKPYEKTTNHYV